MKSYCEVYVPSCWVKTLKETPQYLSRSSWPQVEKINDNVFDLTILTIVKEDDDPSNKKEQFILNYTHKNNEISLVEETGLMKRSSILDDENEKGGQEFTYLLKVIDHNTNTTMYYDVKLARVELEKNGNVDINNEDSLCQHLEVIAKLDDENPFDTEFDEPEDYKKDK